MKYRDHLLRREWGCTALQVTLNITDHAIGDPTQGLIVPDILLERQYDRPAYEVLEGRIAVDYAFRIMKCDKKKKGQPAGSRENLDARRSA